MPFFYYDITYIILIPALILATFAQFKVSSTFNKYSKIPNSKGYTGREVARMILDRSGLSNVEVVHVSGQLTDHYDPTKRIIRLSDDVYNVASISAISVAAHEVGHAIQHQEGYTPLKIRTGFAPIASFSSQLAWIIFLLGFFINPNLIQVGILLFSMTVLFQVITLPVEFNASSRALKQLSNEFITSNELVGAKEVLRAAALTYVASTLVGISQLLRLLLLSRNRD